MKSSTGAEPRAYRVQPVPPRAPGGMATAALMQCMVTGQTLDSMGGGGDFLAPQVVAWLRTADAEAAYSSYQKGLEQQANLSEEK